MAERTVATASFYRHAWIGVGSIVLLFGGLVVWAAFTDIAGAVVAPGTIVVEGGSKRVQHREGGIVKQVLVENGKLVRAGDLLVRLDGTMVAANLAVTLSQLREAYALEARLIAESSNTTELSPRAGINPGADQARLDTLLLAQKRLMASRAATREGLAARLEEQIEQTGIQIEGLEAQKQAVAKQHALLEQEGAGVEKLYAAGLIEVSRVNAINREISRLDGEAGRLIAEIAAAKTSIAERRLQITQIADEFQTEVLQELQATGQKIAELQQQRIAAEDTLSRLEIRAPQSGMVHELIIRTVGGVVGAGETLMLIVPQESSMLIEARVGAIDVDKVVVGQHAIVRLSSFDARTTPELSAEIRTVSADLTHDPRTGEGFYLARVGISDSELARLPEGRKLVPGMPAEAFIQTGDRSVLSYLIHPFTEQIRHAFRED